ncbi:MAG: 30S ribosomal protein S2 [Candidatus Shapirobacteria bacterium GW2011_GWE1_38_10]|uniref:Small ribosomal subunit protein uS2 n=1 Tax=Candidatus Shapirobacteria bacterium GW2011_GWE1_38_10 TaxID=1618488 RepID=A0A0G0I2V7_9BACT|nr:MAG: 30S ribosomal protein S2 [Candidatus Shapirobacteria bacterium GW2011_GWF2_37_20]KKQ49638.1 MAG: 30S ribosomal protein S2 [Candidatus Shapirobacteria bacterium GW2011_GWE1_38_10]KKQ64616.1 MAG: 30S ribosomal protein S2 [Candidatus Shapirobacteria bacterium GW2011_GWF1_38_23]HBP51371.1 30S ribosomal protein S2 [Candidatus Shapirobacteria bacterium]
MKTKTVNRTGKSLVKKALVVGAKKAKAVDKNSLKEANEKVRLEKEALKAKDVEKVEAKKEVTKEDKKYTLTIDVKDLLTAGCHLGHKVSKTNPKIKEYLYEAREGIQLFDLNKSFTALEKACNFIYNAKRNGKQIVMLGTKRQAREVVRRVALDAGVPYITDRWVGGTVSNWSEIKKNIKKLNDIATGLSEGGKYAQSSKKDLSELNKEKTRLERMIGGLTKLENLFDIIFVVDAGFEKTAIKESRENKIKVVSIVDTDSNPEKVDYAITANDDNVKSITVIVEEIGRAMKAAGVK